MGCACSREGTKIIISQKVKDPNQFTLKIHIPNSENIKILFYHSKTDRETLMNLFNSFLFNFQNEEDDELDANFISVYNPKTDSFEYYIQRLAGYEIEDEMNPRKGKMWNFYLNKEKTDWNFVCNHNLIINMKDELELRYENCDEKSNASPSNEQFFYKQTQS